MTETRTFHVGDILSAMTGRMVSPNHIDGVAELVGWMVDEKLLTHQLPRVSEECEASLRAQFPDLATVVIPNGLSGKEEVLAWLACVVETFGEMREVTRLNPVDHTRIDPLDEARMVAPTASMVPVKVSVGEGVTSAPTYPLPPYGDDDRFTPDLLVRVAGVIEREGYPSFGPDDYDRLREHLHEFLYGKREEN